MGHSELHQALPFGSALEREKRGCGRDKDTQTKNDMEKGLGVIFTVLVNYTHSSS